MANRKRWSSTVGSQRGNRVRVYERIPGGPLYCAVWIPGRVSAQDLFQRSGRDGSGNPLTTSEYRGRDRLDLR